MEKQVNELEIKIAWLEKCLEDQERLILKAKDMLAEKDKEIERLINDLNNKNHTLNRITTAVNETKEVSEEIKEIENIITSPYFTQEFMH